MNTVSLEIGWHRVLWAVQPARGRAVLFGEVAVAGGLRAACLKAGREALFALAAEDLTSALEIVVALDGSLIWPELHASAREVLLAVSPAASGGPDAFDAEVSGKLVSSLVAPGKAVRFGPEGDWAARVRPLGSALSASKTRAVALALRAATLHPSEERAAEMALRDLAPGVPVLISSDIAPLWGWSERPVEKTLVSAALLPIVADAAAGVREGLGDAHARVWFASLDGTLVPLSLAERHPYTVLRGLPILSLTAAIAYVREVPGDGPVAAASLHETSSAVARVAKPPQGQPFASVMQGAHIESIGIGAESAVFAERGVLTLSDESAPAGAVPVRAVLAAAGLTEGVDGPAAAGMLAEWLHVAEDAAVGAALKAVAERIGGRMRSAFSGASSAVFAGPLAGALAGALAARVGVREAFLPPAFGASGAVAARQAPRASRAAESHLASAGSWGVPQASRSLEELIAAAVADLEDCGLSRETLAAIAWVSGVKDAHSVFPAMDRDAIAKAAAQVAAAAPREGPFTLEVEVYPAVGARPVEFPEIAAPIAAPAARKVVMPGASRAVTLRVVPAGALSAEAPTKGPALLADPTGLILVPEGFAALPAPRGGTRLQAA